MAIPTRDVLLVPYSTNWNTRLVASFATYGITSAQATAYTALHTPYITAANAAAVPGQKNKSLVAARNSAKAALLPYARELYSFIQFNLNVTDQAKTDLGIVIRKTEPTPVPPPSEQPEIDIVSTKGRTLRIRLHGEESLKRAKPPGVSGAAVFSFVGDAPPADRSQYKFEGNTSQTIVNITFPSSVPNGATVWVTAFWFNNRKQSGPPSDAKSANLPGGSVSMAA